MNDEEVDLLVIGAGPGGYVSAIRAAQLGRKVTLVEQGAIGGVCLNEGCIPSKALITAADRLHQLAQDAQMGIVTADSPSLDFAQLQRWKEGVVKRLTGGVAQLLRQNGVSLLCGRARMIDPRHVVVEGEQAQRLSFRQAILAAGSRPVALPMLPFDGNFVVDAAGVLALEEVPRRLVVVGGGYIGVELGTAFAKLGSQVTLLEALPSILSGFDRRLVQLVERRLRALGVTVRTAVNVIGADEREGERCIVIRSEKGEERIVAEKVLVSVGRRPNSDTLDVKQAGIALDGKGFVQVDGQRKSNVASIYAIGDLAGGMLLAHKASHEGIVAAEAACGKPSFFEPAAIPAVVFSDPEIAVVGRTEEEAKAAGMNPLVARFPFAANGRALTLGESDGFTQVVADRQSHRVLGVQLIGAQVSTLVGEATLAIEMGAVLEDLSWTIHAHPTLSETLMEAADLALGRPIHVAKATR
ncbi:MAG: dihydrolipoyl dehydrogenase [Firmicutes bacterium]|nr:dihydrolipoyl dehydrogenase [Bacillota bacterium]